MPHNYKNIDDLAVTIALMECKILSVQQQQTRCQLSVKLPTEETRICDMILWSKSVLLDIKVKLKKRTLTDNTPMIVDSTRQHTLSNKKQPQQQTKQ